MKLRGRTLIVLIIIFAIAGTIFSLKYIESHFQLAENAKPIDDGGKPSPTIFNIPPPPNSAPSLPSSKLLPVPFTPQAPTANWDELHGEGCEEASVIMANAYYNYNDNNDKNKDGTLDPVFVEQELIKITEWEKQNFGYYLDINSEETVHVIREVYGLNAEVVRTYTEQSMKQYLVDGKLILFPAQGQQLGNPNYRRPGPPYHMLVIKGYTKNGFVTNDPGTRRGASYPYSFNVLYNANGDWDHDTESVNQTKKMIIVVWK